ncbi:kinase-like domain-containing protein [Thelephora terrestris]|uniref:Kinase-like domain-containing protein n=1 Tax=Thelephora terrestris TaxID=56493 RepID=A0A9P6HKP0_9AGAM|nr:kinase-like domain-containing protein [Thelephora terrestris]
MRNSGYIPIVLIFMSHTPPLGHPPSAPANVNSMAPRESFDPQHASSSIIRRGNDCIRKFSVPSSDRKRAQQLFSKGAGEWSRLKHPNVVPLKSVTLAPLQLVSQSMPGGELREYIEENPSANLISLLLGVANGLAYLHSKRVIHGDLKGPNILIDESGNARITNFGLRDIIWGPSPDAGAFNEHDRTPRWTAPELLRGGFIADEKSDTFSFGMIVFEVFSGNVPFHEIQVSEVPRAIMNKERPKRPTHLGLTESLWGLVQKCWNDAAEGRPEMKDVIELLEQTAREYITSSDKPLEESRVATEGPSMIAIPGKQTTREAPRLDVDGRGVIPSDTESPLPGPALPPQEAEGEGPPITNEPNIVGKVIVNKPRQPTINNEYLPKNDSEFGDEEGHKRRTPPKEMREDKDRKDLRREKSRKDLEHERGKKRAEEVAKEVKATLEERPPGPSGSTTVVPSQINAPSPSRPATPRPSTQPPSKIIRGTVPPILKDIGEGMVNKPVPRHPPTTVILLRAARRL